MSEYLQRDIIRDNLSAIATFKFLWKFTRGHRIKFYLYLILTFSGGIFGALAALRFGLLIESLINPANPVDYANIAFIAGLEILTVIFVFFGRKGLSVTALQAILNLRQSLFAHMKSLSMAYYDREPAGRIVTRLTHDVETLEAFYSATLARLISVFLTATTVILIMLQNTFWLGLASAVLTLPSIFLVWSFRKQSHEIYRAFARTNSAITARLAEYLNGMPVIRSFGLENWTKSKFDSRVNEYMVAADKINYFNSWMRAAALFLTHLPMIFLFSVGSYLVAQGALALSVLVAYIKLADRLARPAGALMMEIHMIQTAMASAERLTSFLSEPAEVLRVDTGFDFSLKGKVEFKNVAMRYNDNLPWVLTDFSLAIAPGEKIGVMGRTGSGKSTLISLLTRLYPYQQGELLLDGIPITKLGLVNLRSQIAFVSQSTFLMPGTVRDNLTLGENYGEETILEACRATGLDELLISSQRDLNTDVQAQGSNFSQGEGQLFALTRALLQNPSIMILDEATANLDAELEEKVQLAIERVCRGRTSIFIAHRLSTLTRCDRVLILQSGRVIKEVSGSDLNDPGPEILMHLEDPRLARPNL